MIYPNETVISQYGNSPRLLQMISDFNDCIDPSVDIDLFYSFIFNLDTAQGFGLDIWGKIVGVSRNLNVSTIDSYLGFKEGQTSAMDYYPFGSGILYSGPKTGAYVLSDDAYRSLIYLKALANISDATIHSYNRLLGFLFSGRGRAYVIDEELMKIRYVFEFYLKPFELAILQNSEAIPRPSGVGVSIIQVDMAGTFGFAEASIGTTGSMTSSFELPAELPAYLGVTYDTSGLTSYQPFNYGVFGSGIIQVT